MKLIVSKNTKYWTFFIGKVKLKSEVRPCHSCKLTGLSIQAVCRVFHSPHIEKFRLELVKQLPVNKRKNIKNIFKHISIFQGLTA